MVLTLYGHSYATCTQRVAVVLLEKKVPFNFVVVDLAKGEHKTPEYLTKQPFGVIPYIDDDGFILYESRAISRYIAEKYADQGRKLIPTDLKEKALFEQAASVEYANFETNASTVVAEKVFKPLFHKVQPDEKLFEKHNEILKAKLDVYDKILAKQKYLAGDELTVADLFHLPVGAHLKAAGSDVLETRPNVARWWKELTELPSWIEVQTGIKPSYAYA
ncbi:glutathione S-transferase [Coprinopsis marcescibilis]|uniref:glutathione transferase n=1 Tax=Coprinopsis marcescibilis TaxID=230819 RepID=A0A5C3L3Z3_COPMA|nr:glutathione S-transferase [Coprinopsis marcescibilis]